MTNEQLIRQYYDGDEAALEKLYHKNLGLIRGIAKEIAAEFNCLMTDQHHPNQCSVYTKTILDDLCGEGALELLTRIQSREYDESRAALTTYLYYGLRRSEVLGLRWSAIDMEHKTISISHKVIEAEVDGKFVPMGEDVLKTKSSFRTLPLIPAVGIILLEEKEKQEMYRRLFKKSYCRDYLDYICVDQCGKLLRPNYVTEHFSWLIEKYGLRKVRFHDLRHTCASLLLSNGISMKQIQIWLGHSTFSTTADIYAHLDYSAQEASANAMNGMFNRPEKEEQLA